MHAVRLPATQKEADQLALYLFTGRTRYSHVRYEHYSFNHLHQTATAIDVS